MRLRCSWLVVLATVAACDRPQPLIICHNTNCVGPDTTRDDSLPALGESLALRYDGRPAIDGIEWDTLWYGAESRCIFAHDLANDTSTPATAAAQVIGDYLASTPDAAWNADRFHVFIELKGSVGAGFDDPHTPAQLIAHAECALDALDLIYAGAQVQGHRLTVGFTTSVPALLATLIASPRWPSYQNQPDLQLLLVGDIFLPYSSAVPELSDYTVPLQAIEYHPDYMTEIKRETYRSLGMELVQWQYLTTPESLDAIERWQPRYVLTNEAVLLRGWTER